LPIIAIAPTGRPLSSLRLATFIGLALLGGCSAGPEAGDGIVFDPCAPTLLSLPTDSSQAQRDSATAALALWQTAGGPPLGVLPAGHDSAPQQVLPVGFQAAAPLFYGLYRPTQGDILINSELVQPQALAITIAHEIGHAFGLAHVTDHNSLMNPGNLKIPPGADEARLIFQRSDSCRQ
jgi:hypothetical protein